MQAAFVNMQFRFFQSTYLCHKLHERRATAALRFIRTTCYPLGITPHPLLIMHTIALPAPTTYLNITLALLAVVSLLLALI